MLHTSFQPVVILVLARFGIESFPTYVSVRLTEIVGYIIYNRVMTLEPCQNLLVIILLLV